MQKHNCEESILAMAKRLIQESGSPTQNEPIRFSSNNEFEWTSSFPILDQPSKNREIEPLLHLVNQTIIEGKESLPHENSKKTQHLKGLCKERKILREQDLSKIQNMNDLLTLLKKQRKYLKKQAPLKEKAISQKQLSSELLWNSNQYTIQKLCEEFSCPQNKLSKQFIALKKIQCCTKIEYLLAQVQYSDTLSKQIQEIHPQSQYFQKLEGFESLHKDRAFSFEKVLELAEKAIEIEFPNINQDVIILSALSHFKKKVIKEIDHTCYKIDLTNSYLGCTEKSEKIFLNEKMTF